MREILVSAGEDGRKLGRFLEKHLPKAPKSFLYRSLRQGNVKVDRRKPKDLNLELKQGDLVQLYMKDDQLADFGFSFHDPGTVISTGEVPSSRLDISYSSIKILYEDDHILAAVKPVGILSQKSRPEDISINEMMLAYLKDKGSLESDGFKPAFVHRLDRNTSGIMIMAKDLKTSRALSKMIQNRDLHKYYLALVDGDPKEWKETVLLKNCYRKNSLTNKAEIAHYNESLLQRNEGWSSAELSVKLSGRAFQIRDDHRSSEVEIELLSGKSHQIRAQLAFYGFPLTGDGKYNVSSVEFRQQLAACRVEFRRCLPPIDYLEGRVLEIPAPWQESTDR